MSDAPEPPNPVVPFPPIVSPNSPTSSNKQIKSEALAPRPPATVVPHPSSWSGPVPDLIPGVITGGSVNLFSGAPGVGKTSFIAEWCRRFRDGKTICGRPTRIPAGGIGIIAGDRSWQTHGHWFELAGFPDIPNYSIVDVEQFNVEQLNNNAQLLSLIEGMAKVIGLKTDCLLIIDPISMFIPGDLMKYKTTGVGMMKLGRMCSRLGMTIIGIAHMAKQKGGDHQYQRSQDRLLGSTALTAFSNTAMTLERNEDSMDDLFDFQWHPHLQPPETFQFYQDDRGLFAPYYEPDREAILASLLAIIPDSVGGARTAEIHQACRTQHIGIPRSSFYWYLKQLLKDGKIAKVCHGFWRKTP